MYNLIIVKIIFIIVRTKSFLRLVHFYEKISDKITFYKKDLNQRFIFFQIRYINRKILTIRLMLINKVFFEILKSVIYVTILKTDEQEICLNILKKYIDSTKIGKKKNTKHIKNQDDHYYNKLLNIFEAKNRINLYFILLSKSPTYINCNKLTVLENKYLELVFLGYSKVEISRIFKKQNVTIYKRLDAIYDKLCVKNINEALIKILKENNLYKDISEIITDSEKYRIDFK